MKKPTIKPLDLHFVLAARSRKLKCFDAKGKFRWAVLARGEGVNGPGWTVPNGDTPPGLYRCGQIIYTQPHEPQSIKDSYGPAFVVLIDEEERIRGGHTGVGLHGGRDLSPGRPPSRALDLMVTHGCIRVDNDDLMKIVVPAIEYTRKRGGVVWLTVSWE